MGPVSEQLPGAGAAQIKLRKYCKIQFHKYCKIQFHKHCKIYFQSHELCADVYSPVGNEVKFRPCRIDRVIANRESIQESKGDDDDYDDVNVLILETNGAHSR